MDVTLTVNSVQAALGGTQKLLLRAAASCPDTDSQISVAQDPDFNATFQGQPHSKNALGRTTPLL